MKNIPVIEFPPHGGYPADYLVARLGGRRSLMVKNWEALLMDERPVLPARYSGQGGKPEDAIARALRRELWWVARNMDAGLRDTFRPVFTYFELGTLFSCIRYRARKDSDEKVGGALEASLLSRKLKEALMGADSRAKAMAAAEEAFSSRSEKYRGVAEAGKPAEAEQRLTDVFLAESASRSEHPVIKGFFRTVIDMRNLVSAYKRLRWGIEAAPPIIEGGSAGARRLRAINTETALLSAIKRFAGLSADRPSEVENLFLGRLLIYSKKASRGPAAVGSVLHYLLLCHMEARNLGLIFAGGVLESEFIRREMVS